MNLREDKGYTYGVRTGFDLRRGARAVRAADQRRHRGDRAGDPRGVQRAREIRDGRPATADELALAKPSVTLGYPRGFETAQQVARGRSHSWRCTICPTPTSRSSSRVEAVTLDEVAAAAPRYLDPERMTTRDRRRSIASARRWIAGSRARAGGDAARSERSTAPSQPMKAVRFHAHGGPEVLRYEDAPDPGRRAPARRWSASGPARSIISISGSAAAWSA